MLNNDTAYSSRFSYRSINNNAFTVVSSVTFGAFYCPTNNPFSINVGYYILFFDSLLGLNMIVGIPYGGSSIHVAKLS